MRMSAVLINFDLIAFPYFVFLRMRNTNSCSSSSAREQTEARSARCHGAKRRRNVREEFSSERRGLDLSR